MASPVQISANQLSRLVGTPQCPAIIDVRTDDDFDNDPRVIPTARRHPYRAIAELIPVLQERRAVVICQKGLKLSEGAAAILRAGGVHAEVLEGGHAGWVGASGATIDAMRIATRNAAGQSVWVTRLRPKIDRIACPWLIRRFIDAEAQFLFVAASEVLAVAERFDAIPFDIDDVQYSHRGDRCTFDALLDDFGLELPALRQFATIVRGADTDRLDLAPQAAGLLAASLGLSRMFGQDLEQLDAGLLLYDAFYRWARDATEERHDWVGSGR